MDRDSWHGESPNVKSTDSSLSGVALVNGVSHFDERGSFTRVAKLADWRDLGLDPDQSQLSYAQNPRAGTVRGLHYQVKPYSEVKLIWCVSGSVFDVLLDVRSDSPTYGKWISLELRAGDGLGVLVSSGIAHGYQCLEDNTVLCYLISGAFTPEAARSVRWNDPFLGIEWPMDVSCISSRDQEASLWPPES